MVKNDAGLLSAGIVVALVVGIALSVSSPAGNSVTGASVYVKYYGISNYPLNSQSGKIQTLVKLKQPTLGKLAVASTTIQVASDIVSAADFANGVVSAYQGSPPVPIPTGGLDAVIAGSKYLTDYFKSDTACLRKIGDTYGKSAEFSFVIVSKLAYKQCSSYKDWLVAFVQHYYYATDGKFICRQDSSGLFSIEMGTGKTKTSTFGC
jgi:hypothetical protein